MDQFIKVAGTEGKVGGYFCRLPPLNENTDDLQVFFTNPLIVLKLIINNHIILSDRLHCSIPNLLHKLASYFLQVFFR